mmetsp:Transcript_10839/g.44920  ORF Transcript_10839/g.44920 Transcript_10839/m.44920 type:complete len:310 (-) Transcript_10839:141-1070(-)
MWSALRLLAALAWRIRLALPLPLSLSFPLSLELGDHFGGVAELVQHGALLELLLAAWATEHVVHHGQATHHDHGVLTRFVRVLLQLGLVHPAQLAIPALDGRLIGALAHDVNNLDAPARLLGELIQLVLEQDVGRALVAVQQRHLGGVVALREELQRLVHGRDARAARNHRNGLLAEGVLRLDIEGDVLEPHRRPHLEAIEPLRHGAVLIDLDEQVERALDVVGARRCVRAHGDLALGVVAAQQHARAHRQRERLALGQAEGEDGAVVVVLLLRHERHLCPVRGQDAARAVLGVLGELHHRVLARRRRH